MNDLEALIRTIAREEAEKALAARAAPAPGEFMSPRAAAEYADVHPRTIRRWVRDGKLSRNAAGAHVRVRRSELDALLAAPRARAVNPESAYNEAISKVVRRRITGRAA